MKAKVLSTSVLLVSLALLVALLPGGVTLTKSQGPEPPRRGPQPFPCPPEGPYGPAEPHGPWQKSPEGQWYMPEGARPLMEAAGAGLQATGGPDDFGYTWDDSVPLNWIDAMGGTDAGLSGQRDYTGPINIDFPFKFYENTYNELYITGSGYISLEDKDLWNEQELIPSTSLPNNVIAPYWTPLELANTGPTNRVYYLQGGTAPNRYFVVEWYQVVFGDDMFTFEVVLYENGDMLFQYLDMAYTGPYFCGHAGVEDSEGLGGLAYGSYCQEYSSNNAVRFYRPAPSARVQVRPAFQGRFTHTGETVAFQVPIRNTGDLEADTYDLTVSSAWPVSFYAADGVTPLTDTDGDSTVDTGAVAQGDSVNVMVKVTTPATVNVGDHNTAVVTVRSSLDTTKSKTATLQTAVPAAFAQVFRDPADGAMSLYLVQPDAQALKKTTPDGYNGDIGWYGDSMAVAEMPDSFAYVWTRRNWTGSVQIREIEYTLLDSHGGTVVGVSKLTDHSGATVYTEDEDATAAVAPNGRIGVVWHRYLYDSTDWTWNKNIYYAILDASGNVVVPPTNLTNNSPWGSG